MKKTALLSMIFAIVLIIGTGSFAFAQATPNLSGYFVALAGQSIGPLDTGGLTDLINRGQLNRETLVWREGMPAWVAAGTVEELTPLLSAIPPPLPVAQVPPPIPGQAQQAAAPPALSQGVTAEREGSWYNSFSPSVANNRALFNAGIGVGPARGYRVGTPPLSASLAFRVSDNVPITIGATAIATTWWWETSWAGSWIDYHYTNIGLGARVMYHFNLARNIDYYIGLNLGVVFQTLRMEGSGFDSRESNAFVLWSGIVGARLFFTNRLGIYLETGASNLQWLSAGLAMRF